jgi:WS/DGAT/MGAT family acyltransferase
MVEFMRNSDAFAWGMEHDARLRSTVVTIIMLDRSPDWSVLIDRFERIVRQMPMFRQRVVPTLLPAPPRWVYDADFDLRYHVRRMTAPDPGDLGSVLELARRAEMAEFDHARPLWEVTLVDGLDDGGAALVCKLHHSLADGIGGLQVAQLLFDLEEQPVDLGPLPPEPDGDEPDALDGIYQSLRYDARLVGDLARGTVRAAPPALLHGVRRPFGTVRAAVATAASVYRTVRPINETASPIMKSRRLLRELRVHEVPMRTLKEAAHRAGGTLNDGFLAGVTGGLRLYHAEHGVEVGDLNVTMPVNIRAEGDPVGGNRITLMRFALPVGVIDPVERIMEIHVRAAAVRTERSLPYTQAIAGGLNLLPRWYIGAILRHVDFLASNVAGLPMPVFVGGAKVRMQYAFGPTIGAGVNITLLTYVDTCALGLNVDTGAVPDVDVLGACLAAGFDEVLALAAAPAPATSRRKREPRTTGGRLRA